ncbi:MAG: hypothetical protein WCI03_14175 [bacterium]
MKIPTNLIMAPRLLSPFALAALLVLSGCEQDSHQSIAVSNDSAISKGSDVIRADNGSQGNPETNPVVNYGYYGLGNPGSVPVLISNSDSGWAMPVINPFSSNSLFTGTETNPIFFPIDQPVWSNSLPYTSDYSFGGNGESGCSMTTPTYP